MSTLRMHLYSTAARELVFSTVLSASDVAGKPGVGSGHACSEWGEARAESSICTAAAGGPPLRVRAGGAATYGK